MAHPYWPLFDLRVRTPTLELRYPNDHDLHGLATVAGGEGVHEPGFLPFVTDWASGSPDERARRVLQSAWRSRANLAAGSWRLGLAVCVDGRAVGMQTARAERFAATRVARTGSWLGREHQGRGIGTEMRDAVVHLLFEGFGAEEVYSRAFDDNHRSIAISRRLGYVDNGEGWVMRGESMGRQLRFKLTRDTWAGRRRSDIAIDGLEGCVEMLGIGETSGA